MCGHFKGTAYVDNFAFIFCNEIVARSCFQFFHFFKFLKTFLSLLIRIPTKNKHKS